MFLDRMKRFCTRIRLMHQKSERTWSEKKEVNLDVDSIMLKKETMKRSFFFLLLH